MEYIYTHYTTTAVQMLKEEAEALIADSEMLDMRLLAGGNGSLTKYEVETGVIIESVKGGDTDYFLFQFADEHDCSLDEIIRSKASHLEDEDMELELYRWGVEEPEEADSESFGTYRVLLKSKDGAYTWYKENGITATFDSMADAKEARDSQLARGFYPIIV